MASIVVVGGGAVGLATSMMLAKDGHDVSVLERDPAPPPAGDGDPWTDWERRGVGQFRLLHMFAPRWRAIIDAELPEINRAAEAAGALRLNTIAALPDFVTGGFRDTDDEFTAVTGRRPVMESAIARVAAGCPGLTVRRGEAVAGLLTGDARQGEVPKVVGVRTEGGEDIRADVVVDMSGRRSALPRWLEAIGARPCEEQAEDSGFVYYGRHFRSGDGSLPPFMTGFLSDYGSVSVLTLPADNGTWGVGFTCAASDSGLRGLRDPEVWMSAIKRYPLVAHWADGQPLTDSVDVMAKLEDRRRRLIVDGRPVVTGLLVAGDAWACTNPSLGRGVSIGLLQGVALRDVLRDHPVDDGAGLAHAFDAVTERTAGPWYTATLAYDRHRLAEQHAAIAGVPYETDDPAWEMTRAMGHAMLQDPDVFRAFLRIAGVLALPQEVFSEPTIAERTIKLGADWRDAATAGASREELLAVVAG